MKQLYVVLMGGAGHFIDHVGWRAIIVSIDTSNSRLLEPLRAVQCSVVMNFWFKLAD